MTGILEFEPHLRCKLVFLLSAQILQYFTMNYSNDLLFMLQCETQYFILDFKCSPIQVFSDGFEEAEGAGVGEGRNLLDGRKELT